MIVNNPASSPAAAKITFGSGSNIPSQSGAYYEVANPGHATIAFHINPPANGWVQFQGSFDGDNFTNITFRQIGSDGYTQEASDGGEDFIGSIIGTKAIRFVNVTGTSGVGTIVGTMSDKVSVLEGIEHNAPPHKFGNALFHMGFSMSGDAFYDSGLFTPAARHKFIVTYLSMGIASTNGSYVTLHEGSGTSAEPNKWVFSTYVKASTNDTQLINANLSTPYVASSQHTPLFISSTGPATIRGVVHGYSAEN